MQKRKILIGIAVCIAFIVAAIILSFNVYDLKPPIEISKEGKGQDLVAVTIPNVDKQYGEYSSGLTDIDIAVIQIIQNHSLTESLSVKNIIIPETMNVLSSDSARMNILNEVGFKEILLMRDDNKATEYSTYISDIKTDQMPLFILSLDTDSQLSKTEWVAEYEDSDRNMVEFISQFAESDTVLIILNEDNKVVIVVSEPSVEEILTLSENCYNVSVPFSEIQN